MYKLAGNIRGVLLLLPFVVRLFLADAALSFLLPFSYFFPTGVYDLSSSIAAAVWLHIQSIFTRSNAANITFSGIPLPTSESAIVVANHISWTDFYMIQALAIRAGMLGRCRWFAKSQLKKVPFLGWGLWAMGMPLVTRDWTHDSQEMDRVFRGIKKYNWPTCTSFDCNAKVQLRLSVDHHAVGLIAYSEATRYTPEKYAETLAWCKAHDRPLPQHTLYPRTRGFITTVQQLRETPHVKAVYDLTIAYAEKRPSPGEKWVFLAAPDMWQSLSEPRLNRRWKCHVHVERYPLKLLPDTEEGLKLWLEVKWIEKGVRLEQLRQRMLAGQAW
ncbi:hypothetical protein MMC32_001162 [Xylographa parallela]|nr:hypothetical protein [Xylographa parallela]